MHSQQLQQLLESYALQAVGKKREIAHAMLAFIRQNPETFWQRSNMRPGHVTISAWVISPDAQHVLMMHHRGVDKWVQLGGHIDPTDTNVHQVALRETFEESGLVGTLLSPEIFDVGHHYIPARPSRNESEHEHFDIRFLVSVPFSPPVREEHSAIDLQWIPLTVLHTLEKAGEIDTMIAKTKAL